MRIWLRAAGVLFAVTSCASISTVSAHDVITTPITWSREISAIFQKKCVGCHNPAGSAFALTTYAESRPWAVAIREEALARTMPPWGAVKGFGEFSNDLSLSPEEVELIVQWTEGGVPEGDSKPPPEKIEPYEMKYAADDDALAVNGTMQLIQPLELAAIRPVKVASDADFQLRAELPDGSIEPLLWLKDFNPAFTHDFILRKPLLLPKGTTIRGVPPGAEIGLILSRRIE